MPADLNVKELKAVVFDWDNTLAQSRDALVYAINLVLPDYGLPEWDKIKQRRDNNLSFRDNFPRIFGDKAEEAYRKYSEVYLQNVEKLIRTFPKTRQTIDFFNRKNIPVMIMTNKDRKLFEFEMPLLFKPEVFSNIVCGHEAERDKPDGRHLIWTVKDIMSAEEINPKTVWVVGDSPQDSACAMQANALPIRIGKSIWEDEDLKQCEKIRFFNSFAEFYEVLTAANV